MSDERQWTREVFASRPFPGQRYRLDIRVTGVEIECGVAANPSLDFDCPSEYYPDAERADRRMAELIGFGYRVEKIDLDEHARNVV